MLRKIGMPGAVVLVVVALTAMVFSMQRSLGPPTISYPYVCLDCKAVFDVSEVKEDFPKNYRVPKGAGSDSVVICLRCNKGWAYPVVKCETCKTEYILHVTKNGRCPKCHLEALEAAKKKGVDVIFKRP